MFLPGSIRGLDEIRADSFRNATIDPVKVTAPMNTPTNTSTWWMLASAPVRPVSYSAPFQPTSTAARPTNECSRAISCGIPVICTTRARHSPIAPPISTATTSRIRPVAACGWPHTPAAMSASVATSAMTMPTIPNPTPRRLVSCLLSPARLRMKRSAATT